MKHADAGISGEIVRVEGENFNASDDSIRLGGRKAEPVSRVWPRADSPSFYQVLRRDHDAIAIPAQPRYGVASLAVLRVSAMKPTQDHVGVGENVHYRFQSSSRV